MPLCLYSPNGVPSMGSDKGRIEEDFGPVLLGGCEGVFEGIAGVSSEVGQHFQEDNTEGGLEDCRVATRRRNGDVGIPSVGVWWFLCGSSHGGLFLVYHLGSFGQYSHDRYDSQKSPRYP
jgi:hypothetical protein